MAVPWWQHHKYPPGHYYYYYMLLWLWSSLRGMKRLTCEVCPCSSRTDLTCVRASCTVGPTSERRCRTWHVAVTCWWPHLDDLWTWLNVARLEWTTCSKFITFYIMSHPHLDRRHWSQLATYFFLHLYQSTPWSGDWPLFTETNPQTTSGELIHRGRATSLLWLTRTVVLEYNSYHDTSYCKNCPSTTVVTLTATADRCRCYWTSDQSGECMRSDLPTRLDQPPFDSSYKCCVPASALQSAAWSQHSYFIFPLFSCLLLYVFKFNNGSCSV